MGNLLKSEFGVAASGVKWDIGNFRLWQSPDPDVILFSPRQPSLAKNSDGRYQFGMSQIRKTVDGTYKISHGSAIFTISSAVQFSTEEFEAIREQWISEMKGSAYADQVPESPRFIPLNTRKGTAQILIGAGSGTPDPAHDSEAIGTPGGMNSFLINLTEDGVQEWANGIKTNSVIPAGVKMMYEYLAFVPPIAARVEIDSRRIFEHFSAELNASYDGFLYGGSVKINAEWEKMQRIGAIKVTYSGTPDSDADREMRDKLVNTFVDQALENVFERLFEPAPEVPPAEAGDSGGLFGGTNFAFKWKKEQDITDLSLDLEFQGWTWLKASMDADFTSLVSSLDESYINEVDTQMTAPATFAIDSDPELENVVFSWSASEGKAPESGIVDGEGDVKTYLVTSRELDDVEISYDAKINFRDSSWPIIRKSGSANFGDGGNAELIKPSSYIGRHSIFLFHHDGQNIMPPSMDDYLVCNVSVRGPHLERPLNDSGRITGFEPVLFSYPRSPEGKDLEIKLNAFGVVKNRFVRSVQTQRINPDEEALFILVSNTGTVEIASQDALFAESGPDGGGSASLAAKLLLGGGRPLVGSETTDSESGTDPEREPVRPNPSRQKSPVSIELASGEVVTINHPTNGKSDDNGSHAEIDISGNGKVNKVTISVVAEN